MVQIRENLNIARNNIFTQRLEGTYVKRRPSESFKTLLILGVINIALSLSALVTFMNVFTTSVDYKEDLNQLILLQKGTAYMYIDIEGVYQNYLPYTKSISYSQLDGKTDNLNLADTRPYDFNGDLPYYPAGAIAATYFQDIISFENLEIETEDISWKSETDVIGFTSYLPDQISIPENWSQDTNIGTVPLNTDEGSELPILNERFANWISLSAFGNFKKLWGKIEVPEDAYYFLNVKSISDEPKKKSLFFSYKNPIGIPNYYSVVVIALIGITGILGAYYIRQHGY